ncbi:ribonuclease [candidate division TA06 bacterium SM1_40]|uniref:Ribonuclease Y n=2 Tax=Bacteria division TA06 TaxID=1156500 RepID=A0A0S8JMV0_UNCT6|nr:MAG: ribonuclease [candidate division TA06 bacterium SM23_40]KPL10043.1 MAG: ribonuclease [candidate division TA06 bacterium SM1_40]
MPNLGYLLLVFLVGGVPMFLLGLYVAKRIGESKLINAERLAEKIVSEAEKEAETQRKAAVLEAKDEVYKARSAWEKQAQVERQTQIDLERKLSAREENLERKADLIAKKEKEITKRERDLSTRDRTLRAKDDRLTKLLEEENERLQRIACMTAEEAKKQLITNLEDQARHEGAQLIKSIRDKAKEEAEREARHIIAQAIQRCATDHVVESTVSVVSLPNEEMKGRIIGREGRNIRSFETATGVEVIIDDTPEAVALSGFDPVRREVARIALERLIADGRIHPARIEEIVDKTREEMNELIRQIGEETVLEVGVPGLHPDLVKLLGRLRYRTSYGQNVLQHSREVAYVAGMMAGELLLDVDVAKRAGLLHDLGKGLDHSVDGPHARIGAEVAARYGEAPIVLNAIAAHHEDVPYESTIAVLVAAADAISGARPGARRESLEAYIKRLQNLEEIASSFTGVQKAYAIQAGREVRIIVEPEDVNDHQAVELASDVAKRLTAELEYPGQIKVLVIRETRAIDYAK